MNKKTNKKRKTIPITQAYQTFEDLIKKIGDLETEIASLELICKTILAHYLKLLREKNKKTE